MVAVLTLPSLVQAQTPGTPNTIIHGGSTTASPALTPAYSWTPISTVNAPAARADIYFQTVWTGATGNPASANRMIVWGGDDGTNALNSGGVYNPATDTWTTISTTNAPAGTSSASAVWTGATGNPATANKMIVVGGQVLQNNTTVNTGGMYDPATNSWTAISTAGAVAYEDRVPIWTGNTGDPTTSYRLILYGGDNLANDPVAPSIYDPAADTWTTGSTTNAPVGRYLCTAVWTGNTGNAATSNLMIVYGGEDFSSSAVYNTGGIYNLKTNTWSALPASATMGLRENQSGAWTGSAMVLWGGDTDAFTPSYPTSGASYNPLTNTWTDIATAGAPPGRQDGSTFWTGDGMIVYAGALYSGGSWTLKSDGGIYDSVHNSWTALPTTGAPVARFTNGAVWTGSQLIVFGGFTNSALTAVTNTGGVLTNKPVFALGSQAQGSPLLQSFNIDNVNGTGALTGATVTFSGANAADFAVSTAPSASIAAGGNSAFTISFTPGGTGARSATMAIASNDPSRSPYLVALSGTGNASAPTVTTATQSGVTATSATLGGNVTSDGGASVTDRGIVWGTSTGPTTADNKVANGTGTGTGSFSATVGSLPVATTVYVRAYATNSVTTSYGNEVSFTTLAQAPTVTTATQASVTSTSATLGGNVTSDGGASVTDRGIVWGLSANPTTADTKVANGTGTGTFSATVSGLPVATTVHVRAYATNTVTTSYGSDVSFTTPANPPTIITPTATGALSTTITLGGNVTATGGAPLLERGVVYSLTTANASPQIGGSGVTKVPEGATVTGVFTVYVSGLTASSGYSYSAYATNSGGTSYTTPASTFTTAAPPPAGPPTLAFSAPSNIIYTRPGGSSFTWTYTTGTTPATGFPGTYPVTQIGYYNVTAFNWILTRGKFQYAATAAGPWTDMAVNNDSPSYVTTTGRVFRFVDNKPADLTTQDAVGVSWALQGPPSTVQTGTYVLPDNPPTDITSERYVILNTAAQGSAVAKVTPTDTGDIYGGYWVMESQSVPNLFTLQFDNTQGNTANLSLGTGTLPAVGLTANVKLRYYDLFQTDGNGNPIGGQGFAKTLTFTVVTDSTNDLGNFGNDVQANTYTTSYQYYPAVATLSNGNYVVVWESNGQGKSSTNYNGVYGQIFSATGSKVGGEFVISNASVTTDEINPVVTALNAGRFAVAYSTNKGSQYDIGIRIVEANGTVGSEITGETTVPTGGNGCYYPALATMTDGSFVVAWGDSTNNTIRLQQFAAAAGAKVGSEVTIATGASYQPGVAALSNGTYAVAWNDSTNSVTKVKIGAAGTPFSVGIASGSGSASPRLAPYSGGFVVVNDPTVMVGSTTTYPNIKAALFTNTGTAQGSAFTVNTRTAGNRLAPTVATLSGGGFVIAWHSDADDGFYNGITGRRYDSTGVAVDSADFQINQYRTQDQEMPVVTGLASNLFATAWMVYPDFNYADAEVVTRVLASGPAPTITVPGSTVTLPSVLVNSTATGTTFNISAANLGPATGNLIVTAPSGVQVSPDGATWSGSYAQGYAGGTLSSTAVYVRLATAASPGTVTGNVQITGGAASAVNQAVSGTVTYVPVFGSATVATDHSSYTAGAPITVTINNIKDQFGNAYLPSAANVELTDVATSTVEVNASLPSGQSSYSYGTSSAVAGSKTVQVLIDGVLAFSGTITVVSAGPTPFTTASVDSPPGAPGTSYASIRSGMSIASSGALAFRGYLTMGGTVDADNFMGMWKTPDGTPASVALVARSGSIAPDTGSGLYDVLPVNAVINNAAQTSFVGFVRVNTGSPNTTSSNDSGVWSELGGGGLHLMLREGTAITGGTVTAAAPSSWVATGNTKAAFTVQFASGSALVRGGISGGVGSVTTLATEGGAAPGGGTFDTFVGNSADPRMDASDDVAFLGYLQGSAGASGIYYQSAAGSLVAVASSGQTSFGIADTFTAFERPSLGSSTEIAFRAFLTTNGQAVFKGNPATQSSILPVAVTGDTSAQIATIPASRKLWSIWSPFSDANGRIAFRASLVDTAGNTNENRAILADTSGTLKVIAKVGDSAVGLAGETFANFDHPVIGDGDQAAFQASTNAGSVGVWREAAGGGALALILKVGDTFTINSVTETVASIVIAGGSTDDRKYETKCIDAAGHMLIHVTYVSGKTGILLSAP